MQMDDIFVILKVEALLGYSPMNFASRETPSGLSRSTRMTKKKWGRRFNL